MPGWSLFINSVLPQPGLARIVCALAVHLLCTCCAVAVLL